MSAFENIIKRLYIDIDVHGKSSSAALGDEIAEYCILEFIPEVENKLKPFLTSSHIAIDTLELDLGTVPIEHWETIIKDKFNGTFHDELKKILPQSKIKESGSSTPSKKTRTNISESVPSETIANDIAQKNSDDLIFDAFLFYLEKGYLPWWYSLESNQPIATLFTDIITPKKSDILFNLLKNNQKSVDRIMMIFSDNEMERLINFHEVSKQYVSLYSEIYNSIIKTVAPNLTPKHFRFAFWEIIIQHYEEIRQEKPAPFLSKFLRPLISHINIRKEIDISKVEATQKQLHKLFDILQNKIGFSYENQRSYKSDMISKITLELSKNINDKSRSIKNLFENKKNQAMPSDKKLSINSDLLMSESTDNENKKADRLHESEEEKEGVFVHYAGIVLLHPFLKTFFTTLELLENGQWKSEEFSKKAVQLLAYLSTGSLECPEYESLLFKQVCGLPWDTVIDSKIKLSQLEKNECESLLLSVLEHWTALKNTSIDGLREGFINRSAKLWKDENFWQLQIEQKSQDILLERLPWGLGIIKFPWIKEMIQINWI